MENVSGLGAKADAEKTGVALIATREMLRVSLANYVALATGNAEAGLSIINGGGLPDGIDIPCWVRDAMSVLGQRSTEMLQ